MKDLPVFCLDCNRDDADCICDDRDSKHLPCTCPVINANYVTLPEDCPRHGIGASNVRQNRYWQRMGGHD